MVQPDGSVKLYTSPLLTRFPDESTTWISYCVPGVPAPVVGPMM